MVAFMVERVLSFVDAALYINDYDPANTYTTTTDASGNTFIALDPLGHRAMLTTFEFAQSLERVYSLGGKWPVKLQPLRFEGRVTASFYPVSLGVLNRLFTSDPADGKLVNIYVRPGAWDVNPDMFLRAVLPARVDFSVREGGIVEASVDGVFQDTDHPSTPLTETGVTGAPLAFQNIVAAINGTAYYVREASFRVETGLEPAYALGNRKYVAYWQGRARVDARLTIYGTRNAIQAIVSLAGTGSTGVAEPQAFTLKLTSAEAGGSYEVTLGGATINSVGVPLRVGELVELDLDVYATSISINPVSSSG